MNQIGGEETDYNEHNDPSEFMTFRYNVDSNESTGRSIFSQRFDCKSLNKYEEYVKSQEKLCSFRKKINNARSQQKYKLLNNDHKVISVEQSLVEICPERKNEVLRKKLGRLLKNIKRQQRRQISLQKQLEDFQKQILQMDKEIQEKFQNIKEMQEIESHNLKNTQKISQKYDLIKQSNKKMNQLLQIMENALENNELQLDTRRQDELNNINFTQNFKEKFKNLEQLHNNITIEVNKLHQDISSINTSIDNAHKLQIPYKIKKTY